MSGKLHCIMFMGSIRHERMCERVSVYMKAELEKRGFTVEIFDPIDTKFDMLTMPLHFYDDISDAPCWLQELNDRICQADAYIVTCCEYNHCVPPALINMLDHFPGKAYAYKPCSIVAYSQGIYGGLHAASQISGMLKYMGCINTPFTLGIPTVQDAITASGESCRDNVDQGADKLIGQLEWMAKALKAHREANGVPTGVPGK